MKRRLACAVCFALLLSCSPAYVSRNAGEAQTVSQNAEEPRFTPPPGEEPPEIKVLIDRAQTAVEKGGKSSTDLLTDPAYMSAHAWPRFRTLVRRYAATARTTIVTPQEPGEPMIVDGTVRGSDGRPLKGALIYVYQTSAMGWYSDLAPHISGTAGDERYARLFGYMRTDENGRYEFRTVRPAGYPRTNLPAHIHVEIVSPAEDQTIVTEIQFDDDPRMTQELRALAQREKYLVAKVTRDAAGLQRVNADFQLR